MRCNIVGFARTSLLDWDGNVVAVLYLQGCNLRCAFCHNTELIAIDTEAEQVPWEVIEEFINENREFLDGVVITGGEPTICDDLSSLIARIRSLGVKVKLDTNGTNPDMLQDLLGSGNIDYVAMDIKAPLDEKYSLICGKEVDLERIKRSIAIIMESGVDYEFRTTVLPHYLDAKDVERIAAYVGGARKYALQQFKNGHTLDKRLSKIDPYGEGEMKGMAEIAKRYVRKVVLRGI